MKTLIYGGIAAAIIAAGIGGYGLSAFLFIGIGTAVAYARSHDAEI